MSYLEFLLTQKTHIVKLGKLLPNKYNYIKIFYLLCCRYGLKIVCICFQIIICLYLKEGEKRVEMG